MLRASKLQASRPALHMGLQEGRCCWACWTGSTQSSACLGQLGGQVLGCVALQGAGIGVQHSAQVVAGAIEVWAQAHGAVELGHRVLDQVVALPGGTHAGQLLQDEAPVVESLQHSAASAGVPSAAT